MSHGLKARTVIELALAEVFDGVRPAGYGSSQEVDEGLLNLRAESCQRLKTEKMYDWLLDLSPYFRDYYSKGIKNTDLVVRLVNFEDELRIRLEKVPFFAPTMPVERDYAGDPYVPLCSVIWRLGRTKESVYMKIKRGAMLDRDYLYQGSRLFVRWGWFENELQKHIRKYTKMNEKGLKVKNGDTFVQSVA